MARPWGPKQIGGQQVSNVLLRRGDAALAFILEAVKEQHCLGKLDGINGALGDVQAILRSIALLLKPILCCCV